MNPSIRWTIEKITQRLGLIEPLAYRRRIALPHFRYQPVPAGLAEPLLLNDLPEGGAEIAPGTYWGQPYTNFILRASFQIPCD